MNQKSSFVTIDDSFDVTRCQIYLMQGRQELGSRDRTLGQRGVSFERNAIGQLGQLEQGIELLILTVDS